MYPPSFKELGGSLMLADAEEMQININKVAILLAATLYSVSDSDLQKDVFNSLILPEPF